MRPLHGQPPAQRKDAIGFEAAAALDAYEEQLHAMRGLGVQARQVARLQGELRRVCRCCLRIPQLSGPGIDLLLAHHRLLAELARCGEEWLADPVAPGVEAVERCLANLRRACRELFLAPHLH